MTTEFNAAEVIEMARQIEAKAARFYRQLANASEDEQPRQFLEELAEMEAKHELVFSALAERITRDGQGGQVMGDAWKVISGVLLYDIETDLAKRFRGRQDPQKILREAMAFEKDTIAFFLTMRNMLPEALDRKSIDGLIQEELGHLLQLGSQLAQCSDSRPGAHRSEDTDALGQRPS